MNCEKCGKVLPGNLDYCPTCKMKESVEQNNKPLEMATVVGEPLNINLEKPKVEDGNNSNWLSGVLVFLGIILIVLPAITWVMTSDSGTAITFEFITFEFIILYIVSNLLPAIGLFGMAEVVQMIYNIKQTKKLTDAKKFWFTSLLEILAILALLLVLAVFFLEQGLGTLNISTLIVIFITAAIPMALLYGISDVVQIIFNMKHHYQINKANPFWFAWYLRIIAVLSALLLIGIILINSISREMIMRDDIIYSVSAIISVIIAFGLAECSQIIYDIKFQKMIGRKSMFWYSVYIRISIIIIVIFGISIMMFIPFVITASLSLASIITAIGYARVFQFIYDVDKENVDTSASTQDNELPTLKETPINNNQTS